uniref:photosystem I assembly protein Ycf4 n=1 Tax=Strombomonas costata TaxID=161230 RepID=UPI0023AB13EB|nr:photosystem I assembly protein Ycf4 [Strombomonas costata]WCH63654.1 photosystem I assembly protein Ycf4 [Strombomonas costata]
MQNTKTVFKNEKIFREEITEPNKLIKNIINSLMFLGSFGFLIVGISSYLKFNLIPILDSSKIIFFPQGLTMSLYGIAGLIISINQYLIIYLKVGEGYNEFNKENGKMEIFRKGFPGRTPDINLSYSLNDIESIKVDIKTELFNTKQKIYVCIKGKPDLPIIQTSSPLKLNEIEEKASELASFLKVNVKGL